MKSCILPLTIAAIAQRANLSPEEVQSTLAMIRRAMEPASKRLSIIENGLKRFYTVERRGIGIVTTSFGKFWHYNFIIDDQWEKYSVIVKGGFDYDTLVPVFNSPDTLVLRTDSGCETGQVFGDLTCECSQQLTLALKTIGAVGEGMIVAIPRQDGRGMGLPFKLATLWIQDVFRLDTVEAATLLAPGGVLDVRTYAGVVGILKFFGVPVTCKLNLATNNYDKADIFVENGYTVKDYTPVIIEPNIYTKPHLAAKQAHLGHKGLVAES